MRSPYVAEQRLRGRECSVETLVRKGRVVFETHTERLATAGTDPDDRSHIVPGRFNDAENTALSIATARLVRAIDFDSGFLQAEWMLTEDGPVLIACSGRMPADRTVERIERVWGIDLCGALVDVLAGRGPCLPTAPAGAPGIVFLRDRGEHSRASRADERTCSPQAACGT